MGNMILNVFAPIYALFLTPYFLCFVKALAFAFEIFLLGKLITLKVKAKQVLWFFILAVLSFHLIIDVCWIFKFVNIFSSRALNPYWSLTCVRIGWLFFIIAQTCLALFVKKLSHPSKLRLDWTTKLLCLLGAALAIAQFGLIITHFNTAGSNSRFFEFILYKAISLYNFVFLGIAIYSAVKTIQSKTSPKILSAQLKSLVTYVLTPYMVTDLMAVMIAFFINQNEEIYLLETASTVFLIYGKYLVARKIMRLRFLNTHDRVEVQYNTNFIQNFKNTLEKFAYTLNTDQIKQTSQSFLKEELDIPVSKGHLFIRTEATQEQHSPFPPLPAAIENFLSKLAKNPPLQELFFHSKILVRDELEFTHFYEPQPALETIIQFLRNINADIFAPIYEKQAIIGYIMIEHDARPDRLFGASDQNALLIFATYLGNVLTLLKNNDILPLFKKQKEATEEAYQKHHEVNYYKESIQSFLQAVPVRTIGVIFYKSRRFTYANQSAQEILGIDLNKETGQGLSAIVAQLIHKAQEYKTVQNATTKNMDGNKIAITAMPSSDNNYVIITVHHPDVIDTLNATLTVLKDPSDWDYALYLETTRAGQLINQLIPGSGETLLTFKINLLKAALSKKALLLDMPDEDLKPTVETINHLSFRSEVMCITLNTQEKNNEVGLKLFGINALLSPEVKEVPLLERLNSVGTLFIENIDLLSIETQHALAQFINYGFFKPLRSERRIFSDVRIICSTRQNLEALAHKGLFSSELMQQLVATTVRLPSLISLAPEETQELLDGYIEQTVKTKHLKSLLELTDKERARIISHRAISLSEFKEHVHNFLVQKSTKKRILNEVAFDSAYDIADPGVYQAVRLGKHALKDARIMTMLWNKFQSQSKIAELLGVNRSSVNRRCKQYNLL